MNFDSGVGESPWKAKRRGRTELVLAVADTVSLERTFPFPETDSFTDTAETSISIGFLACRLCRAYKGHGMGEWKAQVSFRVRQAFRDELAKFAAQEKRTVGNLGELILEWGFEQLKTVGSTSRLLKCKLQVAPRQQKGP